jgi:hypothetical protein
MAVRYHIQTVRQGMEYKVWKSGKLVKTFAGPTSYDDAHEYTQDCVEDDRLYAHFYAN